MTLTKIKMSISKALGKGYNSFYHSRNFYRVVKGSRGSKKSKDTAIDYTVKMLKYPWANLLVVRRFSNTNKQSTYSDFKWAANRLGVYHLFKWNDSMPEITVKKTGQKILFRGLDDELKLTSLSVEVGYLCWAWFEEAYQIEKEEKFDTVVESIRGASNEPGFFKQITVTFNPWSERHWLKKKFFDSETKVKDVFARTTTFRINEWLDEQDRQRYLDLYRTNPRRARVVCDGEWGVSEGLVFNNFEVREFDIEKFIQEVGETTHGMDFGYTNDPTTLTSSVLDQKNNTLYIYDELYKTGMLIKDIVKEVEKRNMMKTEITADSSNPMVIDELRNAGVRRIRGAKKGPNSIAFGIDFMQNLKIVIHPKCEHTIEEFNLYLYKQDKEGNWLNEPIDKNNHIIDALRYSLEQYSIGKPKINIMKGIL
ncbi:PBSX family phage terminase large subunit [Lactococcus garvieae]|uniref:PBSX family phage terminase large subunit n=1 Tax=Lactococcus garvieae TaxID=1363 RepID=UPI001F607053|nr:PBSX family phage terminase large subunit [Lactococcus garvieae]MCI3860549.1 PBSX family phage terminase large subunit [Lactococcus garvieae]